MEVLLEGPLDKPPVDEAGGGSLVVGTVDVLGTPRNVTGVDEAITAPLKSVTSSVTSPAVSLLLWSSASVVGPSDSCTTPNNRSGH